MLLAGQTDFLSSFLDALECLGQGLDEAGDVQPHQRARAGH